MAEIAPTRSAALALADERELMRQGYRFLDEKRVLLASEMLRRLREHERMHAGLVERLHAAHDALRSALQRHGLDGMQAYPAASIAPAAPQPVRARFLGVPVLSTDFAPKTIEGAEGAIDASPEAGACRDAFATLLEPLARLGVSGGNLERLAVEYRRTERRARALENVLLPEVEGALSTIQGQLELADQEEAVRIRLAGRARSS